MTAGSLTANPPPPPPARGPHSQYPAAPIRPATAGRGSRRPPPSSSPTATPTPSLGIFTNAEYIKLAMERAGYVQRRGFGGVHRRTGFELRDAGGEIGLRFDGSSTTSTPWP